MSVRQITNGHKSRKEQIMAVIDEIPYGRQFNCYTIKDKLEERRIYLTGNQVTAIIRSRKDTVKVDTPRNGHTLASYYRVKIDD